MSTKPTRAEVLAEYLGMDPETHPWAYREGHFCTVCGVEAHTRCDCLNRTSFYARRKVLNLTDPLAPGTAADAWGPVIDAWFMQYQPGTVIRIDQGCCGVSVGISASYTWNESPTIARVRAMMAADSAFREKMEGAEG